MIDSCFKEFWTVDAEAANIMGGDMAIDTVGAYNDLKEQVAIVCACDTDADTLAYANLISAAPDLYNALKKLYDAIDSCVELTPETLQEALAALKKARP